MKTSRKIQQEIIAAFDDETNLDTASIGVSVYKHIVTLRGQVDSYSKKITAQQTVWHIQGVRALADELDVVLPNDGKMTDAVIAENILQTLDNLGGAVVRDLRLKVEQGQALLEGTVDNLTQKQKAVSAVWNLPYVKDIIDLITIKVELVNDQMPAVTAVNSRKMIQGPWFTNYGDEIKPPTRLQASFFLKIIKHFANVMSTL